MYYNTIRERKEGRERIVLSYIYRVRELIFQKQGEIRERYRGGRDREKKRLPGILNKNDFFKIERDIFQKRFF